MKWLLIGAGVLLLAGCTASPAPSSSTSPSASPSARFVSDRTTTAQCAKVAEAYSDITSAENGYPGQLDRTGWDALIKSAATTLTLVDDAGAIGSERDAMVAWWGSAPPPGPSTSAAAKSANDAFQIVNHLCADNESPLVLVSTYGG